GDLNKYQQIRGIPIADSIGSFQQDRQTHFAIRASSEEASATKAALQLMAISLEAYKPSTSA
ncbi:hypothetical protein, partial [Bacteroides heparinolyticus]|uniref:hypothetical protein n=1 Tax=Prevotella heparinolytica TaxID=28113 RepID=UPI00359FF0F6